MPDPLASAAAGPQWIDLAITSGATLVASIGAAWLTAWMQFRGVKSEAAKRRVGYVRRASSELTEYRDRLDSYHADLFDDLKNGGTYTYVYYWDLTDPSVFSTQQDWADEFNQTEEESIIYFRAGLRDLRDYLKPIQKVEDIKSAEIPDLQRKLAEASQYCGSVVDALTSRLPD